MGMRAAVSRQKVLVGKSLGTLGTDVRAQPLVCRADVCAQVEALQGPPLSAPQMEEGERNTMRYTPSYRSVMWQWSVV